MYFYKEMTAAYYDCDVSNKLKLSAALRYMQQTSSEQLQNIGQAPETLYGEGLVFLLVKSNLRVARMPECSETVRVGTAAVAVKGPRFIREFVVEDSGGGRLMAAWSLWVLADTASHKILRPGAYPHAFPFEEPRLAEEVGDIAIVRPGAGAGAETVSLAVRYSHLDVNHHVNNSMYADFVCDALPYGALLAGGIKTLALEFRHEARHGDVIDITRAALGGGRYYVGGACGAKACFEAFVEL